MEILKKLRFVNPKDLTFSYLNINSVRNKLDPLQEVVMGKVDILIAAETKIDACFPTVQFRAEGYHKPYHLDVFEKSGGILVYINSSMPSRQLHCGNLNLYIQAVPFEINLRKDKWLVISVYRPPSQNSEYFLHELYKMIDYFSVSYDNHVIIDDFNLEPSTGLLKNFMNSNVLYNLINVDMCFKDKRACIDLILSNRKYSFKNTNTNTNTFKNTNTFEPGLSDHHHMIYTMLKSTFEKAEPIKLTYRDYKNFSFDRFKADLENALKICPNSYDSFEQCFSSKLNEYAPKKTKWVRE